MFISHQDIVGYISYLNNKFHVKQVSCKCYILIPCKESGGYSFNVCIILYWFSLMQASYAFSSFNFTIIYELLFCTFVDMSKHMVLGLNSLLYGIEEIHTSSSYSIKAFVSVAYNFNISWLRLTKINPSFSCQKKSITMQQTCILFLSI